MCMCVLQELNIETGHRHTSQENKTQTHNPAAMASEWIRYTRKPLVSPLLLPTQNQPKSQVFPLNRDVKTLPSAFQINSSDRGSRSLVLHSVQRMPLLKVLRTRQEYLTYEEPDLTRSCKASVPPHLSDSETSFWKSLLCTCCTVCSS